MIFKNSRAKRTGGGYCPPHFKVLFLGFMQLAKSLTCHPFLFRPEMKINPESQKPGEKFFIDFLRRKIFRKKIEKNLEYSPCFLKNKNFRDEKTFFSGTINFCIFVTKNYRLTLSGMKKKLMCFFSCFSAFFSVLRVFRPFSGFLRVPPPFFSFRSLLAR